MEKLRSTVAICLETKKYFSRKKTSEFTPGKTAKFPITETTQALLTQAKETTKQ